MAFLEKLSVVAVLVFGGVAFVGTEASAKGPSKDEAFFGAGGLFQNLGRTSGFESGKTSFLGPIMPALAAALRMRLGDGMFTWYPSLQFVPFGKKVHDGAASISILALSSPFTFAFGPGDRPIDLKLGPGLFVYIIDGAGGTTTLNNGNSTAVFARPERTEASLLGHLTVGAGSTFAKVEQFLLRLDADLHITAPLSTARRAYTGILYLSFGVPQ